MCEIFGKLQSHVENTKYRVIFRHMQPRVRHSLHFSAYILCLHCIFWKQILL